MQNNCLVSFVYCDVSLPETEVMVQTVTQKGLKGHPGLNPDSGVKNLPQI